MTALTYYNYQQYFILAHLLLQFYGFGFVIYKINKNNKKVVYM